MKKLDAIEKQMLASPDKQHAGDEYHWRQAADGGHRGVKAASAPFEGYKRTPYSPKMLRRSPTSPKRYPKIR
jgi:hypothetical protein